MATLNEVLSAFHDATQVSAPTLAGSLLTICAGLGGVLVLAWLFQVGRDAMRGSVYRATTALLLVVAAYFVLIVTLGVFYE